MKRPIGILGWGGIPHNSIYDLVKYLSNFGIVYFGFVRFVKDNSEIITKERPLYGYERVRCVKDWDVETFFWDFGNPYIKYFLLNYATRMKERILEQVPEDTIFYCRSSVDYVVLKFLGFKHLQRARRTGISGTSVREKIYDEIKTNRKTNWEDDIPLGTVNVIKEVWPRLVKFAYSKDTDLPVLRFKIPVHGFLW